MSGETIAEGEGYKVTITRSAGSDGAVVIFVDGPEGDGPDDLMPDGAPACRILLNDEAVYRGTEWAPAVEDGPDAETIPGTGLLASDRIAQNSAQVVARAQRAAAQDDPRGERDR